MDTDSMSFCYEEHFPSYESTDFFTAEDESQGAEDIFTNSNAPYWDWEVEQEINGDIALLPMSSNIGMNYLSNSPPAREDFHKIMSEWQHFMNSDVSELDAFTADIPLTDMCDNISEVDNDAPQVNQICRFPGKKIDMNAQCYIVNDEQIKPEIVENEIKEEPKDDQCLEPASEAIEIISKIKKEESDSDDFIDVDTISDVNTPILQAGDLNSLLEQFEASETFQPEPSSIIKEEPITIKEENLTIKTEIENESVDKSKQILEALPQELIMKIKASSKRRVVPVIDAMPNKKRNKKAPNELSTTNTTPTPQDELDKPTKNETVQLDHDYCSQLTPYPKHPQKDSGFESAEEDEQRSILKKQPTVKGADGKLMVSLLKVNTIRNSIITENKTKRKLNLEEYKKRREGIIRVNTDSNGNSPTNSSASSPEIEDENTRLLKHQKKLMQMAEEVLKTPPKSALPASQNSTEIPQLAVIPVPSPSRILPSNIEVKTLVSIGVNTVISSSQTQPTELEDIKPILQSANTKINDNSLITSVIKNIQKLKPSVASKSNNGKELKVDEHGEDKTIVYLDKCRPPVETRNVEIQTEPEVEDTTRHKRKRNSSCSSASSSSEQRKYRRSTSTDSHYSYSSRSSSTSSRSRSRSRSPRRTYSKKRLAEIERERVREVEERRIVYVGGISSSTTKDYLRRRFQSFGPITNISIHFREYGDNYGFVTYMYKADAYNAVEHGNDDPMLTKYDLSFGGRRIFCRTLYADLDNMQDGKLYPSQVDDSFDNLLREVKAKLKKRKSCT